MFTDYAVIAIALSVALVASGATNLTKQPRVVEGIVGRVGVPLSWFPALASAEIARAGLAWVHVPAGKGGLLAGIECLDADDTLAVGVLAGNGRGFCSGMDLKAVAADGLPKGLDRLLAGVGGEDDERPY
jgi:hypothetical protein